MYVWMKCIYVVSSQQTLVPMRVCVLMHVGAVIRQILHRNRSDRSDRLCRLRCRWEIDGGGAACARALANSIHLHLRRQSAQAWRKRRTKYQKCNVHRHAGASQQRAASAAPTSLYLSLYICIYTYMMYMYVCMYIRMYALLLYLSLPINASVLLYSCCTHTLTIKGHVHVRTPSLLLPYSGFTYSIYI